MSRTTQTGGGRRSLSTSSMNVSKADPVQEAQIDPNQPEQYSALVKSLYEDVKTRPLFEILLVGGDDVIAKFNQQTDRLKVVAYLRMVQSVLEVLPNEVIDNMLTKFNSLENYKIPSMPHVYTPTSSGLSKEDALIEKAKALKEKKELRKEILEKRYDFACTQLKADTVRDAIKAATTEYTVIPELADRTNPDLKEKATIRAQCARKMKGVTFLVGKKGVLTEDGALTFYTPKGGKRAGWTAGDYFSFSDQYYNQKVKILPATS